MEEIAATTHKSGVLVEDLKNELIKLKESVENYEGSEKKSKKKILKES